MASGQGVLGTPFFISIPNADLWSPSNPHLYDIELDVLLPGSNNPADHSTEVKAEHSLNN